MGVTAMSKRSGTDAVRKVADFARAHGLELIDLEILASLPPDHVCTEQSGGAILRELIEAVFEAPVIWQPPRGLDERQRSQAVTAAFAHIDRRARSLWGVGYAVVRWRRQNAESGERVTYSLDRHVWEWVGRHLDSMI